MLHSVLLVCRKQESGQGRVNRNSWARLNLDLRKEKKKTTKAFCSVFLKLI